MIPGLGVAGNFKALEPFVLTADEAYICRGISYIQSLVDKGIDVYSAYYQPSGLDESAYNADLAAGVAIVTLKDKKGIAYNIPSSYLESAPTSIEVPYDRYAVMLEFGHLPQGTEFQDLIDKIVESSRITIGLEPAATLARLPYEGFISVSEDQELLKAREANIKYDASPTLALVRAEKTISQLKQQIKALEDVVIQLQGS